MNITFKFKRFSALDSFLKAVTEMLSRYGSVTVYDISELYYVFRDEDFKSCFDASIYSTLGVTYGWKDFSNFDIKYNYATSSNSEQCDKNYYILEIPSPTIINNLKENTIVENKDVVNHPEHYISETGLETIDVIEAFTFDLVGMEAVYTANILKYVCRWKKKNGIQDLKKAQWYLNHIIELLEKREELENENK